MRRPKGRKKEEWMAHQSSGGICEYGSGGGGVHDRQGAKETQGGGGVTKGRGGGTGGRVSAGEYTE